MSKADHMTTNCADRMLILAFLMLTGLLIHAQDGNAPSPLPDPTQKTGFATANASQVYAELLGPGGYFSFNYDGRFGKKEHGLGMRAGIGGVFSGGGKSPTTFSATFPVGLNYLFGKKSSHLELGAGLTVFTDPDVFDDPHSLAAHLLVGYRHVPAGRKGLAFRVFLSPYFYFDGSGSPIAPWGGLSLGYRF
jgi:hypothetical protein